MGELAARDGWRLGRFEPNLPARAPHITEMSGLMIELLTTPTALGITDPAATVATLTTRLLPTRGDPPTDRAARVEATARGT